MMKISTPQYLTRNKMKPFRAFSFVSSLLLACLTFVPHSKAVPYSLDPVKEGKYPQGTLFRSPGLDYVVGTTSQGGPNTGGTIFEFVLNGGRSLSVDYSFNGDISRPEIGGLVQGDKQGDTFYGSSPNGGIYGRGGIFQVSIDSEGTYTTQLLYSFSGKANGSTPSDGVKPSGLVLGSDGLLYGITSGAKINDQGVATGSETIFQYDPAKNKLKTIYSSTSSIDGFANFVGPLVVDPLAPSTTPAFYGLTGVVPEYPDAPNYKIQNLASGGSIYKLVVNPTGDATITSIHKFREDMPAGAPGLFFEHGQRASDPAVGHSPTGRMIITLDGKTLYYVLNNIDTINYVDNPDLNGDPQPFCVFSATTDGSGTPSLVYYNDLINSEGKYPAISDISLSLDDGYIYVTEPDADPIPASSGTAGSFGRLVKVKTDGTINIQIHTFEGSENSDGAAPFTAPIIVAAPPAPAPTPTPSGSQSSLFSIKKSGGVVSIADTNTSLDGFIYGVTKFGGVKNSPPKSGAGSIYGYDMSLSNFQKGDAVHRAQYFYEDNTSKPYQVLTSFDTLQTSKSNPVANTNSDGAFPFSDLFYSTSNNAPNNIVYGLSNAGGQYDGGTLFNFTTAPSDASGGISSNYGFTKLHDFGDGARPLGGIIRNTSSSGSGPQGDFFGATASGGPGGGGTIYDFGSLGPGAGGTMTYLYSFFNDPTSPNFDVNSPYYTGNTPSLGFNPLAVTGYFDPEDQTFLLAGAAQKGLTFAGTPPTGLKLTDDVNKKLITNASGGEFFQYRYNGNVSAGEQVLDPISPTPTPASTDGSIPSTRSTLVDELGNLYTTISSGGDKGFGTLVESVIQYNPPGNPSSGIARDLYGNIIYKTTVLHTFANTDGANPTAGLALSTDKQYLYGTTSKGGGANDAGVIFSYQISTGTYRVLHSFNPSTDGANPKYVLYVKPSGTNPTFDVLWGTTTTGGTPVGGTAGSGTGTLFGLAVRNPATPTVNFFVTDTFPPLNKDGKTNALGATPSGGVIEIPNGAVNNFIFPLKYGGAKGGGVLFYRNIPPIPTPTPAVRSVGKKGREPVQ